MISIRLNPDKETVKDIRKRIKDNNGYCPCALVKTADTKCMCKEFLEQDNGMCRCGLFIKTSENDE